MNAVKNKMKAFTPWRFGHPMKNKTMKDIFRQGPDDQTAQKITGKNERSKTKPGKGQPDEKSDDRYEYDQRHRPMDL